MTLLARTVGAFALAGPALAQLTVTPTPVLQAGDTFLVANGVGGTIQSPVQWIDELDVNNAGDWVAHVWLAGTTVQGGVPLGLQQLLVRSGQVLFQQGTSLNVPAPFQGEEVTDIDTIDLNEHGDLLVRVGLRPSGGNGHRVSLWISGSTGVVHPLVVENFNLVGGGATPIDDVVVPASPPATADYSMLPGDTLWGLDWIGQNDSDQVLLVGYSSITTPDHFVLRLDHDGAGTITQKVMLSIEDSLHDQDFGGDGVHLTPLFNHQDDPWSVALSDNGEALFAFRDTNGPSHAYLGTTELLVSNGTSTGGTTFPTDLGDPAVDVNASGDWVLTPNDFVFGANAHILVNGVERYREGDPVPDPSINGVLEVPPGGLPEFGHVRLDDAGGLTWISEWDEGGTDGIGIFRDDLVILRAGQVLPGGDIVTSLSADPILTPMAVSDDGRRVLVRVTLWDGGVNARDTALMLEVDGGLEFFCDPPQPHHLGGTVTLTSSSLGSASAASGLHLEATGGPDGQFGIFIVSTTRSAPTPVLAGNLCLSLPFARYGSVVAANLGTPGLNSLGQFDASGVLQNIVGTSATGTGFDVPLDSPFGPVGAQLPPGVSHHFQLWYRDLDANGLPTGNFSDGLTTSF